MITVTRKLEFDAGHRVLNHESKCATLHGHRYVVEVTATAPHLDSVGRIMDFSVLKNVLGKWIDDQWDHTTILYDQDTALVEAIQSVPQFKAPYLSAYNPTAENMASDLLKEICPRLFRGMGIEVIRIKLWETPNCFAEASW